MKFYNDRFSVKSAAMGVLLMVPGVILGIVSLTNNKWEAGSRYSSTRYPIYGPPAFIIKILMLVACTGFLIISIHRLFAHFADVRARKAKLLDGVTDAPEYWD